MDKPWHLGGLIDESWNLSESARTAISNAIGESYLDTVTWQCRMYRTWWKSEQNKPSRANNARQLEMLAETCHQLMDCIHLHEKAYEELKDKDPEIGALITRVIPEIRRLRDAAWAAERDYPRRGAQRSDAKHELVMAFADTWEAATGKAPTRQIVDGLNVSPFAQFVRACISELPGFEMGTRDYKGLDDLIRAATGHGE